MSEERSQRRVTFIKAKLRREGEWQDVQIGNVSATGLLVRLSDPPCEGETVEIRRRGCCVVGEVVWRSRSRMGVRATEPIDVDGLLVESDIGKRASEAIHDVPHVSFWRRLRGRLE